MRAIRRFQDLFSPGGAVWPENAAGLPRIRPDPRDLRWRHGGGSFAACWFSDAEAARSGGAGAKSPNYFQIFCRDHAAAHRKTRVSAAALRCVRSRFPLIQRHFSDSVTQIFPPRHLFEEFGISRLTVSSWVAYKPATERGGAGGHGLQRVTVSLTSSSLRRVTQQPIGVGC